MQDSFRRSYLSLTLFGPLAVANGVATFKVGRTMVITGAQLSLTDSGTGAGSTTVQVLKNNTSFTSAISVAGAAASPSAYQAAISSGAAPYPAGMLVQAGDVITVNVTAVPAATAPKGGHLHLDCVQIDT